jgi:hypothetical protein
MGRFPSVIGRVRVGVRHALSAMTTHVCCYFLFTATVSRYPCDQSTNILLLSAACTHSWTSLLTGSWSDQTKVNRLQHLTFHPNLTDHRRHCMPPRSHFTQPICIQIPSLRSTGRSLRSARSLHVSPDTSRRPACSLASLSLKRFPSCLNNYILNMTPTTIESNEQLDLGPSGAAVARVIPVRSIHKVIRSNRVLVISFAFEQSGTSFFCPDPTTNLNDMRTAAMLWQRVTWGGQP